MRRHLGYVNQGKPATDLKILDKTTIPYIFPQTLKISLFSAGITWKNALNFFQYSLKDLKIHKNSRIFLYFSKKSV